MPVSRVVEKTIGYFNGDLRDINHFMKVWGYAKTIRELETLDKHMQLILEVAAVTHDIACPLCREKYGNTNGKLQEKEGALIIPGFLKEMGLTEEQIARIAFLVGHHHTYTSVDGMDYQILIEADYLVNADESHYSLDNVRDAYSRIFKTKSGTRLLKSLYGV